MKKQNQHLGSKHPPEEIAYFEYTLHLRRQHCMHERGADECMETVRCVREGVEGIHH